MEPKTQMNPPSENLGRQSQAHCAKIGLPVPLVSRMFDFGKTFLIKIGGKRRKSSFILFVIVLVCLVSFQNCSFSLGQRFEVPSQQLASVAPQSVEASGEAISTPSSSSLTLAQQKIINSAWVDGAWRPLLGPVPGKRVVAVSDLKNVKIYSESALASNAQPLTAAQSSLSQGTNYFSPAFDYNGDGIIDFMTLDAGATATYCDDGKNVMMRHLTILSGHDLSVLYKSGGILDVCVPANGGATVIAPALHAGSLQYSDKPGTFSLIPQYYANGWAAWNGGSAHFYTPNTSNFALYSAAQTMLQPSALGLSYQYGGQPFNGLVVDFGAGSRYVATTSGRFLQYDLKSYSSTQLVMDSPFLARNDIVGRNYGLIQHDKSGNLHNVFLIAGAHSQDLFADVKKSYSSGVVTGTDVWGAIERHVSSYDLATGEVKQKFYSYAHDNSNGNAYRQRITYPSYARLPSKNSAGSRMIYNVFDGSTWGIHISVPGGVESQSILTNFYVWDVIPIDDETVDLITSPVEISKKTWVPDYVGSTGQAGSWRQENYFPQMKTQIFRWTRKDESAMTRQIIEGGIPLMDVRFPHRGTEGNGTGTLYPTLRAIDSKTRKDPVLIMYKSNGETFEAALLP